MKKRKTFTGWMDARHLESLMDGSARKHYKDLGTLAWHRPLAQLFAAAGTGCTRVRVTVETMEEVAANWAEASIKGRKKGKGGVLTSWGIGYNQMLHGQHNTISIINLHLLTGNVGRKGCGTHSQTGQPNAMSERLMGGLRNG